MNGLKLEIKDKDNKLTEIDNRLKKAGLGPNDRNCSEKKQPKTNAKMLSLAFRVGVELISAVSIGTAIGWGFDRWLETQPWIMILFIVIGILAGMLNIYRLACGYRYGGGYQKNEPSIHIENTDIKKG